MTTAVKGTRSFSNVQERGRVSLLLLAIKGASVPFLTYKIGDICPILLV